MHFAKSWLATTKLSLTSLGTRHNGISLFSDPISHLKSNCPFRIEFIHLLHCSDLPILRVLLPSPAAKYENSAKVLIHLFTDGMDNGSSPEDVAKYQGSVALESQGTNAGAAKGEESLRQSFLYSLDTAFAESSALAKSLQAHLVVINDTDIAAALEDRDKWVLKFLAQRKVAKARAGYALAKGYTPDLASVYKVLQKVYRYFSGSGLAFLEKEGLFRVNGNVNDSKRLANQLLTNSEFLNDFEDSILVAHSLKTALATSPPILPPSFQHILVEVSKHVKTGRNKAISSSTATEPRSSAGGSAGDASSSAAPSANESATMEETTPANRTALNASKNSSHRPQVERPEDPERLAEQNFVLELAKTKIFELPHLNLQCLHILLYLLNLVASQEHTNKMGAANLSTIFTFLLFPELLVPNPGLQELISILVMRVNDVFPHPPQLKVSANRSMSQGNELELPAAPKNVIMPVASSSSSNTAVVAPAPPSLAEEKPRVIKKAVSLSATTHDLLSRPSAELSPPKLQVPESKSNNPTPLSSPRLEGAPAIDSLSSDFSRAVNPMPPSSSSSSSIGPLAHSVSSTLPSTQSSTSTIAQSSTQGAQTSTSPVVSPITSPSTSTTTSPTLKRHASVRPTRDPPPVPTTSSTTTTSPPTLSPTVSKSSLSVAPTNPLPPVPTAPASPPPTPLTE